MARVMVVDDTLFMRTLIKTMLKKAGHTVVVEAVDGHDACRKYAIYKPDLVTMDITMHGMNGLDAVKYIVEHDKSARIIMISAMAQKSMVIRALKNGAKHFIIKPITVEKVIQAVNAVMGIQEELCLNKEDFKDIKQSIEEMKDAIRGIEEKTSEKSAGK